MPRKIRVLVGKPGLDGHDRGAKVVAAALRDAGMEVIYTGLHQTPEQVVEAAVQEDVDVVALSILSGAHMTLFPEVRRLMEDRGIPDKLLTGGGIIPPEDMETLGGQGVGRLFGPGSSTQDIVGYIREWYGDRHGADALPPLPAMPEPRPLDAVAEAFAQPAPAPRRAAAARPRRRAATPRRRAATPRRRAATPRSGARGKTASRRAAPARKSAAAPRRAASAKRGRKAAAKRRATPRRSSSRRPGSRR